MGTTPSVEHQISYFEEIHFLFFCPYKKSMRSKTAQDTIDFQKGSHLAH